MISICIPIYNFNIASLFSALVKQAEQWNIPFEIICLDDCSEKTYRELNKKTAANQTYIQLEKNIGRAKIRNLFLQYVHYENLLFLDCDSLLITNNFLKNYLEVINQYKNYNVACDGRVYEATPPQRKYQLRWLYGIKRESQDVNTRNKLPNSSFMPNNFLIQKEIFSRVHFEERLTEYGHEDTLFGYELKKNNISIFHINNPVLNGHLESNREYLQKTEKSIANLTYILRFIKGDLNFINDVKLLQAYYKMKNLKPAIQFSFILAKPLLKQLLLSGFISLRLFDFYKLGLLTKAFNSKQKIISAN